MTKKMFFYNTLKYFLFFLLFVLLQFANIDGMHFFAFGMLFALVWCNQKIYIIAPLYVITGLFVSAELFSVISLLSCVFVFVLFYLLHKKFNKPLNTILIGLYAFISQGAYLYINSFSASVFFRACVSTFLGIICLYAYLYFMQSLIIKGIRKKLNIDEIICAGILIISLGAGISSIPDFFGIFSKILIVLFVFFLISILGSTSGALFSMLLGIGCLLVTKDFEFFLLVNMYAIILNLTKNSKKIFSVLGLLLIDVFSNLYVLNYYDVYQFLSILVACLIILIIPNKTVEKLSSFFISEKEEFGAREMINRSREMMLKKLFKINEVFKEMQNIYIQMANKNISADDAIDLFQTKLNDDVCKNCINRKQCLYNNFEQNKDELKNLIALAISRGKISLVDVSTNLISKCEKIYILVNYINDMAKDYKDYAVLSSGVNSSRLMLADQISGVRDIISNFSEDVKKTITFDIKLEEKIKEELMYENILCSEVLVFLKEEQIIKISLVVKNNKLNTEKICKIIEKILKTKFNIETIEKSKKVGYALVVLKRMPSYDIVFGKSSTIKNNSNQSGDTHSVLRISDTKVFMSICDGMGSGSEAKKISEMSLDLVEKFYSAGFDNHLIISNVNKLLSLREEENFSALDICVFDLEKCYCELIKIGATIGFIKTRNETIIVETSALPLGILENIVPTKHSFALSDGDMVVLLSDGVVDAFKDIGPLKDMINNFETENPQILSDMILEESLKMCGHFAEDDMTVLVGKIWKKI